MMGQGGMMGGGGMRWNNVPDDCLQSSWYSMGMTGGMMGYAAIGPMMMSMMMGAGLWQPAAADAAEMPVTVQQAHEYAQAYLDTVLPGTQAEDGADTFYGYYTRHILRDGQIIGMLSVNGYSGQVWLHHWHGDYITMTGHE
jgi:hypothetical protein